MSVDNIDVLAQNNMFITAEIIRNVENLMLYRTDRHHF